MFDGATTIISFGGSNITLATMVTEFFMLGYDHHGDFYCTKSLQVSSTPSETNWRQITANSVNIICTPSTLFLTATGFKAASDLVVSTDSIKGLSGTTTYNFGGTVHSATEANYHALLSSFTVTANSTYVQTATSYGLRTTVCKYLANRFIVRDV